MPTIALLMIFVLVSAAVEVAGQSLADVAKQEQERRKQVARPARVYTNKDVKSPRPAAGEDVQRSGEQEARTPEEAPARGDRTGSGEAPAIDADAAADEGDDPRGADERRWRKRMADARRQLERSQVFAEALQSRINALTTDFTARDDPAQRAQIDVERKRAIAELDTVKSEIQQQIKAIADLEEEARRAGVPPGWLR